MIHNFAKYIHDKTKEYIIFDIGSRDCQQSIEFYHSFPNSKIYAFECNPNTLPVCRKNIAPYSDRIILIEGAVCDYDGSITFYPINQQKTITSWPDGNPGASSLFKSNGSYNIETYVQDEIQTNCHRLDTIMKSYNIPTVDILWMDLQGAELLALKSLGIYLSKVQYIHTEVSHKPMYSGQVLYSELNGYILDNGFSIKNQLYFQGWQEDAIYINCRLFDIVIPVGKNDIPIIREQIQYTKRNIIGYRNIYLITNVPELNIDGCITIQETIFPFSKSIVASFHGQNERNGWYLQQLLKLYAGLVIPNILERYLVIDADTFFLKPTQFIGKDSKCMYNFSGENHKPYFEHMKRLSPEFEKMDANKSGICHHMLFETKYVREIIQKIEESHGDLFYNCFLKTVDNNEILYSGASEYELYFNYICKWHPDRIIVRPLNFVNAPVSHKEYLNSMSSYDYASYHWYL